MRCVSVSVAALVFALAPSAWRFAEASALLMELTKLPLPAAAKRAFLGELDAQEISLYVAGAQVRGRRYKPRARGGQAPRILLLHGVHADGIDEPRLTGFARALARVGVDVMTPELTALAHYQVRPELAANILELAGAWASAQGTRSVGVMGISFAGGLALIAAAAQGGSEPIGYVVSVGAHHDLDRVCEFYAGNDVRGPAQERPTAQPHPYGARVFLRAELPRLVGQQDLALATEVLDSYLHDRPREARRLLAGLSPAAQRTMGVLIDPHGSEVLSRWLLAAIERERAQLAAASPRGQLAGLEVPVLLLHGSDDPVVPSIETRYLAAELPSGCLRELLVTDLLRHAELSERPKLRDVYHLARFMQRVLHVARATASANAR